MQFSPSNAIKAQRIIKHVLIGCTVLALAGCGDSLSWLFPKQNAAASASASLDTTLTKMEADGTYPILDRSSDLKGPDSNNNGVRDDVEAYIASLPHTGLQKKALMQLAKAQRNKLIVDVQDKAALQAAADQGGGAIQCLFYRFEGDLAVFEVAAAAAAKLEAFNANTRERIRQYMTYNRALSGSVISDKEKDFCDE